MSVARVYTQVARKDQGSCNKCGTALPPGTRYHKYYIGFRSNYAYKRCTKPECFPRPSERESSKMAGVYAAEEGFEDALAALDAGDPEADASSIEDALAAFAEGVREVAQEYRDASSEWEQNSGGENYEWTEKADGLESAADEIENFNPSVDMDDVAPCTVHGDDWEPEEGDEIADLGEAREACTDCQIARQDAWAELIEEARVHAADIDWGF